MGKNNKLGLFFKIDRELFVKKEQLFRKISGIFANPEVFPSPLLPPFNHKRKNFGVSSYTTFSYSLRTSRSP
jgi:hypothetical protein